MEINRKVNPKGSQINYSSSFKSPRVAREVFLREGATRDRATRYHPLVQNKLILPTPPLQDAFKTIADKVFYNTPGTFFIGRSRIGKTFAIAGLISFLAETFLDVAFCTFLANDHDAPTEAALYGDMLVSLGLHKTITSRSSAWQRRRALVAGLIALAEARNAGCIVIFVDEAQNYTPPDLTRLRDVSNELGLHGISLQTIFFGTDQLSAAKVDLREKDRDDIVGRFLLNKYEYRGIESISELHALLSLCDDPSMCPYPEGSDISITEFFMPEQYASAWRLAQEAERLYALLCPRGKNRDMQVGMQTLSETIRTFLFRKWTGVAASPENLDVAWRESLESARRWP
ncbi:ATP-binding protein [Achromobacter denitrificans]